MHLPSPLWGLSYTNGALHCRARLVIMAAVAGTVNGYLGSVVREWPRWVENKVSLPPSQGSGVATVRRVLTLLLADLVLSKCYHQGTG